MHIQTSGVRSMQVSKHVMPLPRRAVPPLARIRQKLPDQTATPDVRKGAVRRRVNGSRPGK